MTFLTRDYEWVVLGQERSYGPAGELPLLREESSEVAVSDLRAAIRNCLGPDNPGRVERFDISVTDVPAEYFEPEYAGGNVALLYDGEL